MNKLLSFLKGGNLPLAVILITHSMLGIAFNLATPIFEAPDEPNHYLFVRYLQVHHSLPVQAHDPDGPRAHHPPLYYLLGALLSAWVPVRGSVDRIDMQPNGRFRFRFDDLHTDNKAVWIHYGPEERWPYHGQALVVHIARLLSVAFSALAVWLTYQAALQLRPMDTVFATLATGLLAFNPMVLFASGVVNNDSAALASGAAVVYVLGLFTRRGFTFVRWLWMGVVFSLGVLLKTSALALALPISFVLLLTAWRAQRLRAFVDGLVGLLLPLALLDGWWFARNQILYGDWTANAAILALWGPISVSAGQWFNAHLFWTGLLGRFGMHGIISFPNRIYLTALLAVIFSMGGWLWLWLTNLRTSKAAWRLRNISSLKWLTTDVVLWIVQIIAVLAVTTALAVYAVTVSWSSRYMLTAYPSIALLLAAGLLTGFRPGWQAVASGLILVLTLGLALYALFGLLIPTYALPRSPSQAELNQMAPLDADIGDTARVLGYKLSAQAFKPGDELDVTIYWLPQAQTDIPYTVFAHLYEPSVGSITQLDTYPGLGNYATTVWDTGRVFADTYRLRLPADAPAVNGAKIVLGLYDEQSGQRLPVTGANAGTPDEAWVEFGNIRVQP